MPIFEFKNLKLNYRIYGEGKIAILFIHGLGGNGGSWKYQVDYFQKEYQIIAVDLFGHGLSSKDVDPIEASRLDAEVCVDLMQKKIGKPYFVIGHSFATNINPEIIKIADPLLKGVVFVDCIYQGFPEIIDMRIKFAEKMLAISGDTLAREADLWYNELIGPVVTPDDRELIHSSLKHCSIRWLFEAVAGCRDYCAKYPPDKTPTENDLPVLIMEADNGVGDDIHKSWVNHFKNARYYLFENAGHFFFITERDRFNRLLKEFIEANS